MKSKQLLKFVIAMVFVMSLLIPSSNVSATECFSDGMGGYICPDPTPPPDDTTAPSVSISSPSNGATVHGAVSISASASDSGSGLDRIILYIDGSSVKTEYSTSISYSWNTLSESEGSHDIKAKAYDNEGNSNYEQISVTVNNILTETIEWDAVPTSGGNNYAKTWSITRSAQDTNARIQTGTFRGRDNAVEFYKSAHYSMQMEQSSIDTNNPDEFTVYVDYYGEYIKSYSWGPTLKVKWDNGGTAWIRDRASSSAEWGMSGQSRVKSSSSLSNDIWYRLRIKVTPSHVSLDYVDVTNDIDRSLNLNWSNLMYASRTSSMFGDFSVTLGTPRTDDYSSSGYMERYYYDAFSVVTGKITTNAGVHLISHIPADRVSTDFTSDIYEWQESHFTNGVMVDIDDSFNDAYGQFRVQLGYSGDGDWQYENMNVELIKMYRPWFFAQSEVWYSQQVNYGITTSRTENTEMSIEVGVSLGDSNSASVTVFSSETNTRTVSEDVEDFTAVNGATAVVYVQYYVYHITGFLRYITSHGVVTEYDVDATFIRNVDTTFGRYIVHTGINHAESLGQMNDKKPIGEKSSFGSGEEHKISYSNDYTRTSGIKFQMDLGAKIYGPLSGHVGITYEHSITFSSSTQVSHVLTFYGENNPPATAYFELFNTIGLNVYY